MRYILFFLLITCAKASTHSRALEEFKGDQLVIGIGNYPYFVGQRVIDEDQEYSIDRNKRVFPCLVADGLNDQTYAEMPDERFSSITFEHCGFSPYFIPSHIDEVGSYKKIVSGAYNKESWIPSNYDLAKQLFRILKPAGCYVFKTAVLEDIHDFVSMNLSPKTGTGTLVWMEYFEHIGFEIAAIEYVHSKQLSGFYLKLTAFKTRDLKRRK